MAYLEPKAACVPLPHTKSGSATSPVSSQPLSYLEFEFQLYRSSIHSWVLPIIIFFSAMPLMDSYGSWTFRGLCTFVILQSLALVHFCKRGDAKMVRWIFLVYGVCQLSMYALWLSGTSETPPVVIRGDLLTHIYRQVPQLVIGMSDRSMAFFVAFELLLFAANAVFSAYIVPLSWPLAMGKSALYQALCLLGFAAVERRCKAAYLSYLHKFQAQQAAGADQASQGMLTVGGTGKVADSPFPTPCADAKVGQESEACALLSTVFGAQGQGAGDDVALVGTQLPADTCEGSLGTPASAATVARMQQQQQQQQQPKEARAELSTEEAIRLAVRTKYYVPQRIRRYQVHVKIHSHKSPEELPPGVVEDMGSWIASRFPGSTAENAAVRVGCIVASFTLCSAGGPLEPLPSKPSLPLDQEKLLLHQSIRAAVLLWLRTSDMSQCLDRAVPKSVDIQVAGHVAKCKWNASKDTWEAGEVVEVLGSQPTAPAAPEGSAPIAKPPKINIPNPVALISTADAQRQQQQQQGSSSASTSMPLTLSLQHANTRPLAGWGSAEARAAATSAPARRSRDRGAPARVSLDAQDNSRSAAAAASGSQGGAGDTHLYLLARACSCFLPVSVRELAQEVDAEGQQAERQVEVTVQLPPHLGTNTHTPFALELELWEQNLCLASHPVLAVPTSLAGVAHELQVWAAALGDAHARERALAQHAQPQLQQLLEGQQDSVWDGLLAFLLDLSDYLHCEERLGKGQQTHEQIAVMDAVGADLLHHARDTAMHELAALLTAKAAALAAHRGATAAGIQARQLQHAPQPEGQQQHNHQHPHQHQQLLLKNLHTRSCPSSTPDETAQGAEDAASSVTASASKMGRELRPVPTMHTQVPPICPRKSEGRALSSRQISNSSSVTASSVGSRGREESCRSVGVGVGVGGKPGAEDELAACVMEQVPLQCGREVHRRGLLSTIVALLLQLLSPARLLWHKLCQVSSSGHAGIPQKDHEGPPAVDGTSAARKRFL